LHNVAFTVQAQHHTADMTSTSTLLTENCALLRAGNPQLASRIQTTPAADQYQVVVAHSGSCVLKVGNITFHSMYDPDAEGIRFVHTHAERSPLRADQKILIFGFGFAYHLRHVCRQYKEVHVFEPDINVLRCAFANIDMRDILCQLRLYTDPGEVLSSHHDFIQWDHQPSRRHSAQAYVQLKIAWAQRLCTPCAGDTAHGRHLKILVVTPIYGGSLPIAHSCHKALLRLGHEVRLFDSSLFNPPFQEVLSMRLDARSKQSMHDLFMRLISEMLLATCEQWAPDLVFALSQAPISIEALKRLKQRMIATAFWFVEDYTYMQYWKQYASHYDVYFTIQDGDFHERLRELNMTSSEYLPLAADCDVHRPLQLTSDEKIEFGSDVSFLGAGYYNRQKMFTGLLDHNFKIWGTGWDTGSLLWGSVQRSGHRIDACDASKIFNATAVNINLHSSACHDGINPRGDYINPRTFEIAACEAFQLVDERAHLARHFHPGAEIVSFSSLADLRKKIHHYLRHPTERRAIAEKARRRIIREHTYVHRMASMIESLRRKVPAAFQPKGRTIPIVSDVESFCAQYPDTYTIFDAVKRCGGTVDIDQIGTALEQLDAPSEKAVSLLKLMHAYHQIIQDRGV
jgi:spore maturation protein CgeB